MFLTRCLNVEQKTGTQTTSVDVIYVFIVGGDHVLASREEAASILLIYPSPNRDHYASHFLFLYDLANNKKVFKKEGRFEESNNKMFCKPSPSLS